MSPKERPRPSVLRSISQAQETGHGRLYVHITYKRQGKPFEVFTHLGYAGSCERAWMEAVSRCISAGLRHGVPATEFVQQLQGIRCSHQVSDPERRGFVTSPADGIAKVMRDFLRREGTHED